MAPPTDMDGGASLRVVIADDFPPIRRLLAEMLREAGHVVVGEAGDGRRAIELVASTACDVVIMDVNMPVLDGFEATQVLRREHPEVRVVAFSSSDELTMEHALRDAGASAYFVKPDVEGLVAHFGTAAAGGDAGRAA